MTNLNLAVIGNCQIAALVDSRARINWACMPRMDGDPLFCSLLMNEDEPEQGAYWIELADFSHSEQRYEPNTAILVTTLHDRHGASVRITDFAPRFQQYGRSFRPVMLIRSVVPLSGSPRISIRLRPSSDWNRARPAVTYGSNHVRWVGSGFTLRLTTDASIASVVEESRFVLERPVHLVLGNDETLQDSPADCARQLYGETRRYWEGWVRSLAIPFEWQEAVIRAAITLKLCTFEDTGAVLAALTTSIPEAADSGRNWDYRYCWLRDSYYVVHALNRLGATRTMEEYLRYILNVAARADEQEGLQPLYGLSGQAELTEHIVETLPGYRGMGPVRVGNQAWQQVQNDVYGAVVLSAAQYFFDTRLSPTGRAETFKLLQRLGSIAAARFDQPDAGLWEYRGRRRIHTYSALMCWAACDRLARIARQLDDDTAATRWAAEASRIHAAICDQAWDESQQAFTESFGRPELDASLLTMNELGFLRADDPRFVGTVRAIEGQLRRGSFLFRYRAADDFGEPENAFNICTFWYINALAATGRMDEARELFEQMLARRNPLGLLSEDLDPASGELWGNFPQTYSMVGIINSAVRLSKPWEDAF
ncbi:MAG: glycoside hydrolase family 15 protein [Chromatiales bacterium]|nr:glycoside hydrolase family 15 protein [Chromatiales bacterium]